MKWRYFLLAYGFTRDPREIKSPLIGRRVPSFTLMLFDGGRFELEAQRGKVVVVSFWASWCAPCREEAPLLEAAWRASRDRGIVFVGVDDALAVDLVEAEARGLEGPQEPAFDDRKVTSAETGQVE